MPKINVKDGDGYEPESIVVSNAVCKVGKGGKIDSYALYEPSDPVEQMVDQNWQALDDSASNDLVQSVLSWFG